ncbi:MAG: hypothetical protein ACRCTZ_15140 [Sarcina sp.]
MEIINVKKLDNTYKVYVSGLVYKGICFGSRKKIIDKVSYVTVDIKTTKTWKERIYIEYFRENDTIITYMTKSCLTDEAKQIVKHIKRFYNEDYIKELLTKKYELEEEKNKKINNTSLTTLLPLYNKIRNIDNELNNIFNKKELKKVVI